MYIKTGPGRRFRTLSPLHVLAAKATSIPQLHINSYISSCDRNSTVDFVALCVCVDMRDRWNVAKVETRI